VDDQSVLTMLALVLTATVVLPVVVVVVEVAVVASVDAVVVAVALAIAVDVVVVVAVAAVVDVVAAQTVEVSVTSRGLRRLLTKSSTCILSRDSCLLHRCRQNHGIGFSIYRLLHVGSWVVGFVGCRLLDLYSLVGTVGFEITSSEMTQLVGF